MANDETFKPFTMVHTETGRYAHFMPTDRPGLVHVRFKGNCGQLMENLISFSLMADQVAFLFERGYEDGELPDGA